VKNFGGKNYSTMPCSLDFDRQCPTKENLRLLRAANEGDLHGLKEALENGANPDFLSYNEGSALHIAGSANEDTYQITSTLIKAGAQPSITKIGNLNTPLHECSPANAPTMKLLVETAPQCQELQNLYGNRPLHCAARVGSGAVASCLLESGADVNAANHRGSTPLHIAAHLSSAGADADPYIKVAELLLKRDEIDLDQPDVNGCTPLHIAAQRGCNKLVQMLVDRGSSLRARTSVDSKGRGGRTAKEMAIFAGHESTAQLLGDMEKKHEGEE